jgi:putative membrane protein
MTGLTPLFRKNDKQARLFIYTVSFVVFAAVAVLSRVKLEVDLGFDIHIFAKINAIINSVVSLLLVAALVSVKNRQYVRHKQLMLTAILLSVLFLVSYIAHHLLAGETKFGDLDHDGVLNAAEKMAAGPWRIFYYLLLPTHIVLAAVILPFILFTAYRSLTGEYDRHKKLARYTWPLWLYVSVSGVLVYLLISPYYA